MTTTLVHLMRCDHADCDAQAPKASGESYVQDRPDGWTDLIHTHACPDHGPAVAGHAAKITSQTRGRGVSEKTTWFLACSCGWRPTPNYQTYNATRLRQAHLAHVRAETSTDVEADAAQVAKGLHRDDLARAVAERLRASEDLGHTETYANHDTNVVDGRLAGVIDAVIAELRHRGAVAGL